MNESPRADAPRVIVADDQQDVLTALRLLLKNDGMSVTTVSSPAGLVEAVRSESSFDVAIIDLNYARDTTSGREGLDLLPQIHAIDASLPVIVMTAWGTIDVAV